MKNLNWKITKIRVENKDVTEGNLKAWILEITNNTKYENSSTSSFYFSHNDFEFWKVIIKYAEQVVSKQLKYIIDLDLWI